MKENFKIALVISRFNEDITRLLYEGALQRLKEVSFPEENITAIWVPGAVEIPVVAQHLIHKGYYAAVITLGAVIQGETTHFDYVCDQVSQGCQRVALDYGVPVIFGVLTTSNKEQALDRCGGKHGHKGREAVDAALEMVSILHQIG